LIFGLIWFHRTESPSGIACLTFIALTAAARVFLEAFRGDSTLIFGGLRLEQVLAWIVLAVALLTGETIKNMSLGIDTS
jgi:prolipoprotein diacylglyceryltransferase